MIKNNALQILLAVLLPMVCYGGTPVTWVDGGGDGYWETASNWSSDPSLPNISSDVTINMPVSGLPLFIESSVDILSFTIGASANLGTPPEIGTGSFGSLQVDGAVTNNLALPLKLSLPAIVGATSTWSGSFDFAGSIALNKTNGTATTMTLSGGATTFDNIVKLTIDNSTTNSVINVSAGTATFAGATIKIYANTGYVPVVGNTWTFISGSNFAGATLDTSNILLADGLAWGPTNFLSTGVLTVIAVPEPATWALLSVSIATAMIFRRRRTRRQ